MEFTFSVRCDVTAEHTKGDASASVRHVKTDVNLDVSKNLERDMYFTKDGVPNKDGVKAMTQTLIQGLVGNIHYAKQNGYWDDVEHIKHIVAELTRGFATITDTHISNFDK